MNSEDGYRHMSHWKFPLAIPLPQNYKNYYIFLISNIMYQYNYIFVIISYYRIDIIHKSIYSGTIVVKKQLFVQKDFPNSSYYKKKQYMQKLILIFQIALYGSKHQNKSFINVISFMLFCAPPQKKTYLLSTILWFILLRKRQYLLIS